MRSPAARLTMILAACSFSCDTTEPPPPPPPPVLPPTIALTAVERGVTDAVIRVLIPDSIQIRNFKLCRDTQVVVSVESAPPDTTIWDQSLSARRTFSYRAYRMVGRTVVDSSTPLLVTTLDTTSHVFHWEMDTLGFSSIFHGASIVNNQDIWAMGLLYEFDSLGMLQSYNGAHWDGSRWELKRIRFPDCDSSGNEIGSYWTRSRAIRLDDMGNGYLTGSIGVVEKTGTSFIRHCVPPAYGAITTFFSVGIIGSRVWLVGGNGWIVSGSGGQWVAEPSGTTLTLGEVGGGSVSNVFAVGASYSPSIRGVVLRRTAGVWTTMMEGLIESSGYDSTQLFRTQLYGTIAGLWVDERGTLYTAGVFLYQFKRGTWDYVRSMPDNAPTPFPYTQRGYLNDVEGNASNDLFVAGDGGTLMHFNGSTWQHVGPGYDRVSGPQWARVSCIPGGAVAVGLFGGRAIVIRLWR